VQFGGKSEKLERQIEQLQLRLEALPVNDVERVAVLLKQPERVKRMVRPVRSPLPAHLPREVQTLLPQEEACPDCGATLAQVETGSTSFLIALAITKFARHLPAADNVCKSHFTTAGCPCSPPMANSSTI